MDKKKPRLVVTSESTTGMNQKFQDTLTGEVITRTEVARRIDSGQYEGYHHYRNEDGKLIIRSNPDGSEKNNLG